MASIWAGTGSGNRDHGGRCPICEAKGSTWDTMRHEPWCPNFMRTVDECDGRQLMIELEEV